MASEAESRCRASSAGCPPPPLPHLGWRPTRPPRGNPRSLAPRSSTFSAPSIGCARPSAGGPEAWTGRAEQPYPLVRRDTGRAAQAPGTRRGRDLHGQARRRGRPAARVIYVGGPAPLRAQPTPLFAALPVRTATRCKLHMTHEPTLCAITTKRRSGPAKRCREVPAAAIPLRQAGSAGVRRVSVSCLEVAMMSRQHRRRSSRRTRRRVPETAADQAYPIWVDVSGRRMFVVGYTPGGAPYGIFEDEMDADANDLDTSNCDQSY